MKIVAARPMRVLDFDIETRPSTYWHKDRPTMEITVIAAAWTDKPKEIFVWRLGVEDKITMLTEFRAKYDEADMVTGHYIRQFDLMQIQAELAEFGLPPLNGKLTEDTKNDLIGWGDLPKTQEYLGEMLGIKRPKVQMSQHKWRQANRLLDAGMEMARERAVGDVAQHMELRLALRSRGLLLPPKHWSPYR